MTDLQRYLITDYVGTSLSDAHIFYLFSRFGLSQEDFALFCEICTGETSSAQAKLTSDQLLVLSKYLETSWFTLLGVDVGGESQPGASAGGTLADQVLLLAICRVCKAIYSECNRLNLLDAAHDASPSPLVPRGYINDHDCRDEGTTCFDDLAIAITGSAAHVAGRATSILSVCIRFFAWRGFVINLGPGKTAVTFCFRGQGAKTIRLSPIRSESPVSCRCGNTL